MSTAPLAISPPDALARLSAGLRAYHAVSGKSAVQVLVLKGGQLLYGNRNPRYGATFDGLVQLFSRQSPRYGSITEDARVRGFRLGRTDRTHTADGFRSGAGIGRKAFGRAIQMMGNFKSIIIQANPHTGDINFVRGGTRKARVHFRYGRKSFPMSGDFQGPLPQDEKRVNLRAVATIFELRLREQGRGFLASSFLFKRWRSFAKEGFVPAGTPGLAPGVGPSKQFGGVGWRMENVNPRSFVHLLGAAELTGDVVAGNATLRISSHVPGVNQIGAGRGLFAAAIAAVSADVETYLARKQVEQALAFIAGPGRKTA